MMNILIQLIAVIAWFIIMASYYTKSKIKFILLQIISYILYAFHFYFLGGITGSLLNILSIIILFLLLYKENKKTNCYFIILITITLYLFGLFITYDGIISLLAVFACLIPILINWQNNFYIIKIGGIIGAILWLIYGLFYNSISIICMNIIFILITIYSIYKQRKEEKYDRLQKNDK